ncbi:hypothetical protein A2U01_0090236, partial [Trifolium medium]|nr:hypothetical protein [Trifolium medium]
MGSGRYNEQICNGCPAEDTLIQGWAIDDRELDCDRFCRFIGTHSNDQVDIAPGFGRCAIEALE